MNDDQHKISRVSQAHIMPLERLHQKYGSSTEVKNGTPQAPFDVKRIFYLYDVPADSERGGHSHYKAQELMVALGGSFDVTLNDGKSDPVTFTLNRPYKALYIPAGLWRTIDNFSAGAVCLVLTSEIFSEADYVRDFNEFLKLTNAHPISVTIKSK